jgi:hypothetical protein
VRKLGLVAQISRHVDGFANALADLFVDRLEAFAGDDTHRDLIGELLGLQAGKNVAGLATMNGAQVTVSSGRKAPGRP